MHKNVWFLFLFSSYLGNAEQYYDATPCSSQQNVPGSTYTCKSSHASCQTLIVYRANQHFPTVLSISTLFNMDPDEVLKLNGLTSADKILKPGREVLLPITCHCVQPFYQANHSYKVPENTTFEEIACGVFEGLLKSLTLMEANPYLQNSPKIHSLLHVPLRCACPDNTTTLRGIRYLVTYPLTEGDGTIMLSEKFGVPAVDIWTVNSMAPFPTVYPYTTVLVPLRMDPAINLSIPDSEPPSPGFLPTFPIKQTGLNKKLRNLYVGVSVAGFSVIFFALIRVGLYLKAIIKLRRERVHSLIARSSPFSCSTLRSSPVSGRTARSSTPNSCLSPDLLIGIKYSLSSYGVEDISRATREFHEDTKVGDDVYIGLLDDVEVVIKQMKFDDTRHVIDMHSKINHINIVRLHGVCYGESDSCWSYLVFECPRNGCLRDSLSNSANPLNWYRRTQIAFDIAVGLHYLHCCTIPPYTHTSLNSRNIFLTGEWRAKVACFGITPVTGSSVGNEMGENTGKWIAPEFLQHGIASEKVDIFAFGVILLELISAREDTEGNYFKASIGFLGGGAGEGGCFEQLRNFMDPGLKEDYPLAEALCLAVLAKACVEEDPLHRPSMDDVLKVLARMV